MNSFPDKLSKIRGHTLIELGVVVVLMVGLAGMAFLGVLRSIDIYSNSTENYLEIFQEGKIALEKMLRELRETNPDSVTTGSGTLSFTKKTGHGTPEDSSLSVSFSLSGDIIERSSSAGTFGLVDNVSAFTTTQDAGTDVVTVNLTLSKGGNTVRLRSAVLPRQPDP